MDEFLKRFNDRINGETLGVVEKAPKASTDGFLGKDGTWNSQVTHNGKKYRERVEILIFSKDTVFLAFKPDGTYKIPGGGTEPGNSMEVQVIHEAREEAEIVPKNIAFVLSYGKDDAPGEHPDSPYDGAVTNLFVGEFGHQYTGSVHDVDLDEFIKENGRFYRIDEVYPKLNTFHKKAVDKWLNNELATESVHYMSEMTRSERNSLSDDEFGIPKRRAFPLNDEDHVKAAINMFRHCPEKDRKKLAERIFAKYREFNMDTQISKRNPLWKYAKKANGIVTEGVITIPVNHDRLDNYKQVPITEEIKIRYSMTCPALNNVRVDSRHSGYVWFDEFRVIGFVDMVNDNDEKIIDEFYIEPEYKASGIGRQMIVAAKELGATKYSCKFDFSEYDCMDGLTPNIKTFTEDASTNYFLNIIDSEMEFYLEAPNDGPTDYTATANDDAGDQTDDDDADMGEPTDYSANAAAETEDDDMNDEPTDYTATANAEGENNQTNSEESTPDNANDDSDDSNAEDGDNQDVDNDNSDNQTANDGDDSDDQTADNGDDDEDMGEPTDYTDDADNGDQGEGDSDANGDDGGNDQNNDGQDGNDSGNEETSTEEQIDDTRKSRNLYKKFLDLYAFSKSCINKLDSLPNSTTNSSIVIQGVKKKFVEINELMNDYMITKFMNDTLIEQDMHYNKFLVSVAEAIELLKNNKVYLKQ